MGLLDRTGEPGDPEFGRPNNSSSIPNNTLSRFPFLVVYRHMLATFERRLGIEAWWAVDRAEGLEGFIGRGASVENT
jgi:hypothetical protein